MQIRKAVNTCFSIWLLIFLSATLCLADEVKTVTANGEAVGSSISAKEEALQRALRNAVENGVGVYISSESKVENYQLLEDKIYSRVKGYVKKYTVLSEVQGEDGVYRVKIEAEVAADELKKDLSDLGLLIVQKGKPRTMIIISEDVEGKSWFNFYSGEGMAAEAEMEKVFLEKGFQLISKEQLKDIKENDAALSFDDPERAAALGNRFGAELVIVGKAVSDKIDSRSPYGLSSYYYAGEVQAKVVKVDTAEIIASDTRNSKAWDSGRFVAARKALKESANALAVTLIENITSNFRDEIYNASTYQIVVDKIEFAQLQDLEQSLKNIVGVQKVFRRSFAKNTAVLDVEMQGTLSQLSEDVSRITLKESAIKITGTTANRIDVTVVNKP